MAALVERGLTRFIGVSNFDRGLVERCQAMHPVASVQNELSMLVRDDVDGLLPWLAGEGIGYLAYSPLANGLLTGAITRETVFPEGDWRGGADARHFAAGERERHLALVDRLRQAAGRSGCTVTQLALRWVLAQPGVTGAIVGTRNGDHIAEAAGAGDVRIADDVLAELGQP
jgi:aryl-alcohol dehydrogenase-like predicted oxidoreductase